jgi:hypothetical protein
MLWMIPKINSNYLLKHHYPISVGNKNIFFSAVINKSSPYAYFSTSSRSHMLSDDVAPRLLNRPPDGD